MRRSRPHNLEVIRKLVRPQMHIQSLRSWMLEQKSPDEIPDLLWLQKHVARAPQTQAPSLEIILNSPSINLATLWRMKGTPWLWEYAPMDPISACNSFARATTSSGKTPGAKSASAGHSVSAATCNKTAFREIPPTGNHDEYAPAS